MLGKHATESAVREIRRNTRRKYSAEDKKEIIQLEEDGEVKEAWTGNYIFENIWQSFRTKKNQKIELIASPYTFEKAGKYKVMVKVVDIVGVDTSHVVEVEVK